MKKENPTIMDLTIWTKKFQSLPAHNTAQVEILATSLDPDHCSIGYCVSLFPGLDKTAVTNHYFDTLQECKDFYRQQKAKAPK